jgi:hypothetical protein
VGSVIPFDDATEHTPAPWDPGCVNHAHGRDLCTSHINQREKGRDLAPIGTYANRDGLDCRRENLRAATSTQNHANTTKRRNNSSGFKGVFWHRRLSKWFAQITCNGKQRHLGCFADKESAADAYARAARELFGEFARTE